MNPHTYIVIMAGGVGARFWPASRAHRPKQFLDILRSGRSLLRMTFERSAQICPIERILVVANADYISQIREILPELPEDNILGEPQRNNTAPCIAWTALHLRARSEKAVFTVLPSDHVVLKEDVFVRKIRAAMEWAASHDVLLTLGIRPTRPDTGYGYIELSDTVSAETDEPITVRSFREKPDLETAKDYLDTGRYLWNAGIFIWSISAILSAFRSHAADVLSPLLSDATVYGGAMERDFIRKVYAETPNISVDYAILERADNVATIPADIGWSDLGTWNSLYDFLPKDNSENIVQAALSNIENVSGSFIKAPNGKWVVIDGLDDYIVIDEADVLLIVPRSKEQEIRRFRKQAPESFQ